MATPYDVAQVEERIRYHFQDQDLVALALRAPEKLQSMVTGDVLYSDDGNRRLAQLGQKLLEFVLTDAWYGTAVDRGESLPTNVLTQFKLTEAGFIQNFIQQLSSHEYLAGIAMREGIDTCIARSERQADQTPPRTTLKLALTAIIGAVWIDSSKNMDAVSEVIERLR